MMMFGASTAGCASLRQMLYAGQKCQYMIRLTMPMRTIAITHDELKELLGVSELLTVTREQVEQELETVLDIIDAGHSPILIKADGKPDLLMFSWSDFKRRYALIYPPEEFERVEKEFQRYEEAP